MPIPPRPLTAIAYTVTGTVVTAIDSIVTPPVTLTLALSPSVALTVEVTLSIATEPFRATAPAETAIAWVEALIVEAAWMRRLATFWPTVWPIWTPPTLAVVDPPTFPTATETPIATPPPSPQ